MTLGLIFGFLISTPSAYGDFQTKFLHSNPIPFNAHQLEQLKTDMPFSDLMFDSNQRLWLSGKSSLWLFDHSNKSLKRIKIRSGKKYPIKNLTHKNGYLFAATDRDLYRIELEPFKVVVFKHPSYKKGSTNSLVSGPEDIWWIHDDGLVHVSTSESHQQSRVADIPVKKATSWFDTKNKQLWSLKGGQIIVTDFRRKNPQSKVIHDAKHAFINIQPLDGGVLVHSNYTVLKFNQNQQIDQIIPVENQRKLIAFSVKPQVQSYLFNDQLLEIYDLAQNIKFQTYLQLPANSSIFSIIHNDSYSAVLTNHVPIIYKHSQQLNLSQKTEDTDNAKTDKAQL